MSYPKYVAYNFGPAYAGKLTHAAYALDGGSWQALAEKLDPNSNATGIGYATVTFPDSYTGGLLLTPDTTAVPLRYVACTVNPGDDELSDAKVSTRSAPATAQTIDLTQSLADVNTATVGGALHGAYAVAFGKMILDAANRVLKLFGWNSQTAPLKQFTLDSGSTPSTRTPQ